MHSVIIAEKVGMTRLFTDDGRQTRKDEDRPDFGAALDAFVFAPNNSTSWGSSPQGGVLAEPEEDRKIHRGDNASFLNPDEMMGDGGLDPFAGIDWAGF